LRKNLDLSEIDWNIGQSSIGEVTPVSAVPAMEMSLPTPIPEPTPDPEPAPTPEPVISDEDFVFSNPVMGGIIKPFSVDDLVYFKTTNDWRTHSGIDIEVPSGSQVKAVAAGVVEKVYADEKLGVTVVIGHTRTLKTVYSNLQSMDFIKVGKRVEAGDIIGGIGDTAIVESEDGPHLHFEVIRNGEPANPEEYLMTNSNY